jgi:hypothetical protein
MMPEPAGAARGAPGDCGWMRAEKCVKEEGVALDFPGSVLLCEGPRFYRETIPHSALPAIAGASGAGDGFVGYAGRGAGDAG